LEDEKDKKDEGEEKRERESAGRRMVSVDASFKMPGAYGVDELKGNLEKAVVNEDTHRAIGEEGPGGMTISEMRNSMLLKRMAEFLLG
jgi:hypothetical protein